MHCPAMTNVHATATVRLVHGRESIAVDPDSRVQPRDTARVGKQITRPVGHQFEGSECAVAGFGKGLANHLGRSSGGPSVCNAVGGWIRRRHRLHIQCSDGRTRLDWVRNGNGNRPYRSRHAGAPARKNVCVVLG